MPQVLITQAGEPTPIPDTYTPVSTVGAYLIDACGPWVSLHLAWYLDAIGVMFEPVAELVTPVGFDGDANYVPGYGSLFDPTVCSPENLPYLGQYVGVQIPAGTPDDDARAMVIAENGQQRGTLPAVLSAIKRHLFGTQSVTILERVYPDGSANADWSVIIVRPEEIIATVRTLPTISAMEAAYSTITALEAAFPTIAALETQPVDELRAAVDAVKPWGLQYTIVQTDGWTISQMEAAYSTLTALEAAFPTLANLETDVT